MNHLWPHQIDLYRKGEKAITDGYRWILFQLATGGGKTKLAIEICRSHISMGGKVLWLAPRIELINQASHELTKAGLSVGCLQTGSSNANPYRPVQVGSIQTLQRRNLRPEVTLVIADEARHYVSDKWQEVLTYYKSKNTLGIGLDATPARSDGKGLVDIYDTLIPGPSIKYLIEQGVLVPCNIIAPKRALQSGEIAQCPIKSYTAYCNGEKCVIFAQNIKSAKEYKDKASALGIPSGIVTSEDDFATRKRTIEAYKAGRIKVLTNVNVLTEGWDDPTTANCILARSVGSMSLYLQIVGRIIRASEGKSNALLIDLFGSSRAFGTPEMERVYSLRGEAIQVKDRIKLEYQFCQVCGAVVEPGYTMCGDCHIQRTGPIVPEVVNVELFKFAWLQKDNIDQKLVRLTKWIREAIMNGHKPGRAWYRYMGAYKEKPDTKLWQQALRNADKES